MITVGHRAYAMQVLAIAPSVLPSTSLDRSLRPSTSRCAPAAYRSSTGMGWPSTKMGRTPSAGPSDPQAQWMTAVNSASDACRRASREGTPRRGAYGASISVGDDQAWTAQISVPRRRASAAAHRRAATEPAEQLTPTTMLASVLTMNWTVDLLHGAQHQGFPQSSLRILWERRACPPASLNPRAIPGVRVHPGS